MIKIAMSLVSFTLLRFLSFLVLNLTCDIALGLIHIFREQSSEGIISLFLDPDLVLVLTSFIDQIYVVLSCFCKITYSPPLGALTSA
jgi:hypothetical protein